MQYRIIWDNPYWLFCTKSRVECLEGNSLAFGFEINRNEDVLLFEDVHEKTKWIWHDRYKSGAWAKAHAGVLVDNANNVLAKTECLEPNERRVHGAKRSTVFNVFVQDRKYSIEWNTTLFLYFISKKDIMSMKDADEQIVFESITPSKYLFSVQSLVSDIDLLAKVFTAYHIKIPMECIGE